MAKIPVFSDDNYEISYDDGIDSTEPAGTFWLLEKKSQNGCQKINLPFDIQIQNKEISIISEQGKPTLYYRTPTLEVANSWVSKCYEPNRENPLGGNELGEGVALPGEAFTWHKQRNEKLTVTQEPENANFSILFREEINHRFQQNALSFRQKKLITGQLCDNYSELFDLKQSCISKDQYAQCLRYLIEGGEKPANLLAETSENLKEIEAYLKSDKLHLFVLNNGGACTSGDHMATLGEAKQFVVMIFQEALRQVDPDYAGAIPQIEPTPASKHLCYSGESDWMKEYSDYNAEIYKQNTISSRTRTESAEIIETIAKVYKPLEPDSLKDNVSLEDLQKAADILQKLMKANYESSPLLKYTFPFLSAMANAVRSRKETFEEIQKVFLMPLYESIATKIAELDVANPQEYQPKPAQFRALRVDEWNGVSRFATHADFVNEQFKNPGAIFIIPDNFTDAALPLNERHTRQGRGGLANPMAPVKIEQAQDGSPVYDLCTLSIPTGGTFNGEPEAAKAKVKEYFAKLYEQVKLGRTIVVPYVKDQGKTVPAFGNGIFKDAKLTAELKLFIFQEFEKLKSFCEGTLQENKLDEEYKKALVNDAAAFLPRPKLSFPTEIDEAGLGGKNLFNPGIRANFKEWFRSENLGELVERQDEKDKSRTLCGKLSTGVEIVISEDKMFLKGAETLTDEEFKNSMRELIQIYVAGYAPGSPPPAVALGNEKQKQIIAQLLTEANVSLHKEKPVAQSSPPTSSSSLPAPNNPGQSHTR